MREAFVHQNFNKISPNIIKIKAVHLENFNDSEEIEESKSLVITNKNLTKIDITANIGYLVFELG